jgi:hypothetical protein
MQASWWRKEEVSMIAEGPADLRRLMIGALSRFRRTCGRLDRVAYLNYLEYRRGAGQDNSGRDQKPMRTKDCGANTPMLAMVSGNSLHSGPRRTDHRGLGPACTWRGRCCSASSWLFLAARRRKCSAPSR